MSTTDLFQSGRVANMPSRPVSPVPSERGEAVRAGVSEIRGEGEHSGSGQRPLGSRGVFREQARGAVLVGRAPPPVDRRKFRYDVVRGAGAGMAFEASKDDRMSAVAAGDMLERIHEVCGVSREVEGVVYAFDQALWFMHAVNGASTIGPGRAKFSVPGSTMEFSFSDIRDVLGVDARRFFRAFADDVKLTLLKVQREYDPMDPVKAEHWGWVQQIAYERALHRFPHLIHDSADACLSLSPPERAALSASKAMVIGSTNNSVDRLRANNRAASAEGYDSMVGDRV